MIEVKKKKLTKKSISLIITASVLVFLIAAYALTNVIIGALEAKNQSDAEKPDYIAEIGESYYGSYTLAYPSFTQDSVTSLDVLSHKGNYAMRRDKLTEEFLFFYEDDDGEIKPYSPDIVGAESTFDYSDLYAIEDSDGLNIYKITYLLATIGTLMIDQRIPLAEDSAERTKQLNRYGLGSGEEKEIISVKIKDSNGEETEYDIEIGDKLLAGSGYYFRVNNRNYVYTSSGTYIDYALGGFENLISSNIVAEGLSWDGVYEPYFTPEYSQWKNSITKYDKDSAVQALVKKNSTVVVTAKKYTTITSDSYFGDNSAAKRDSDGYKTTDSKGFSFDLAELSELDGYKTLTGLLTGMPLGPLSRPVTATIVSDKLTLDFGDKDTLSYKYEILEVESVITDGGEYASGDGYTRVSEVPSAKMVRVAYNYYVDGEKMNEVTRHAVVELSRLGADAMSKISSVEIGKKLENVNFSINYDKKSADSQNLTYVISEIAVIFEMTENGGYTNTNKVTETSAVSYRYYIESDGKRITEDASMTVEMAELKEGNELQLKNALLGKSTGKDLNIKAFTNTSYTEIFADFTTYVIESADYFIEKELIVSFEFLNESERPPFYIESIYANKLPSSHRYSSYALNSTTCESVVELLGGIGLNTSSTNSEGLAGSETVSVGITPEKMEKYGLYANTVYFVLPRNIETITNPDQNAQDDYMHHSELGFTLYISDYDHQEGCRYIASDMYDIIVKYEGDDFDYLDLSFLDYYARRSMVSVKYTDIKNVTLDFYMEDYFGGYDFDTQTQTVWVIDGQQYLQKPEDSSATEKQVFVVDATVRGSNSGNKLTDYTNASGKSTMSLAELYNAVASEELGYQVSMMSGSSSLGAVSFQDMLHLIYSTYYLGHLTDEEQAEGKKTENKLMSISFTIDGLKREEEYRYDFYRIDDGRVMVSLYNPGYNNEVSDFYITTFAFKKIVNNFDRLLNGIVIDSNSAYD